jgi:hypothetical protein
LRRLRAVMTTAFPMTSAVERFECRTFRAV